MKRIWVILSLMLMPLLSMGHNVVVPDSTVTDTIYAQKLRENLTDDDLIFALLEQESKRHKALQDSVHEQRLKTDTTSLNPFHIGYGDSLRMAEERKRFPYSPLSIPMLYTPETRSSAEMVTPDSIRQFSLEKLYTGARRYVTQHAADVYQGVYDASLDFDQHHLSDGGQRLQVERSLFNEADEDRKAQLRRFREARSPWRKQATIMLQLSQNYVSPNWYQGGNSNFALLGTAQGYINYDNKDNITWENSGEWRMGFSTIVGDTLRKVNTNDDVFKLYSKFGYKIYKNLYVSTSGEFQTQLFDTWKVNTKELKTGTFTPLRFNFTVGIDYKPVKGLSIVFSPLAYKLVYARDTVHVAQTNFSIPKGQNVLNDVGSSLRVDWSWTPLREIALDSKFYFYTNYKRVEVDWEVTCNFIINRYMSARVILHPRYDNTVILADQERAKIQFKELISVGFAHKFY